jgi:parallel beta-helix repeat protein
VNKRWLGGKLLAVSVTCLLVLPLLFALAGPVFAVTRCVNTSGTSGCSSSIQAAVNAASANDVIHVYPGSYNESVHLSGMAPTGNLTIVTVDATGTPTPGTATVNGGATGPAFTNTAGFTGNVTIDGFIVTATGFSGISVNGPVGNVDIRNVTANGIAGSGINVTGVAGNATLSDCTANDNDEFGINVVGTGGNVTLSNVSANDNGLFGINVPGVAGYVTLSNCTANGNDEFGINVASVTGYVRLSNCTANDNGHFGINGTVVGGKVTLSDCTANGNDHFGINVTTVGGKLTLSNCTANDNDLFGINATGIGGDMTITDCVVQGNQSEGVILAGLSTDKTLLLNGSIICDNGLEGLKLGAIVTLNTESNWWGCKAGPGSAGCDTIDPGPGTVDYTPWIDTITPSAPASAMAGDRTMVSFQFSDSSQSVFLGQGPGDLHGDPTFVVTTDNGTITEGGFINQPDGVMEVTLVPDHTGTATVWADGPCGLDAAAVMEAWEFVPEPGSILLLGSGLAGLAGYATLRWRTRE